MDDRLSALLSRAFHHAPAMEANTAIARMREEQGDELGEATSYEVMLPGEGAIEHLTRQVMPRLVYFLDCHGAKLPACAGVFVSFFVGSELYFIHAADVVAELSRLTGLSTEEMVKRYGSASV